jgi:hypothetical protein
MSEFTYSVYTEDQMTELANQAKELIIGTLGDEGLLKGDPEKIAQEYVVVVYKKGRFGQIWDKFRGVKENGTYLTVLKVPNGDCKKKKKG